MAEWMIKRRCPNYLISGNTVMAHIPDEDDMKTEVNLVGEMY